MGIASPRLAAHRTVAAALGRLSDRALADLVESGVPLGAGIGGQVARVEAAGRPVFVKQIRLTDVERRTEHLGSTANVFGLPPYCHYGVGDVGSPGFGAWRELAVHTMTTKWVLSGRFPGFPLTYHWRVLPHAPRPLPVELADVDRAVTYWGGGPERPGLRERLDGLRSASASLTVFLEHLPLTLHDWLGARLRTDGADAACALVERELAALVSFLHDRRLLHFDGHFRNVLTDGRRLYLADHGLALSARFDLTPPERAFLDLHRGYDRAYVGSYLVKWLVTDLYGYVGEERAAFVRACAGGLRPQGVPAGAAALVSRHAPVAAVMERFERRFREESRSTPFPADALRRADRSQKGESRP
ncbi:protein kinase family protein [Streptomyces sp. NBC_01275]|uniref:protein kinase family protein n=1 Tax=Streptomyces sp. NBC_01275 TaxID=2903807 RepID=UPI0022585B2E|nr:protein kinase family protein [Streptomyces sp. NBC_01275]MCX4759840.1 protein kinase family protein [Streptomyces sp. NBC_01275]